MRKKVLLLANMSAGKGDAKQMMVPIVRHLVQFGCEVIVYPIVPAEGLLSEPVIKAHRDDVDVIACCGGDGTLNHIINQVMKENIQIPIAYIPSGSSNDFSRNINGDADLETLCRAIAGDHIFRYDIGRFNDRYFNYVAGFGAFTRVSYATDQNVKQVLGYAAYIMMTLGDLPASLMYRMHARVIHDQGEEEDDYIFCGMTNSVQIAGVRTPLLGHAELNDGLFELLLVRAPGDLIQMNELIGVLSSGQADGHYVKSIRTAQATFMTEKPVDWTVDGEYGGLYSYASIRVINKAIPLMVSEEPAH